MSARLITRSPRSDSATPLLRERHWLPIVCRVDFKLLVLTYKAMHNDAPVYLCELRSANNNMLEVKRTRTKAGDGLFDVTAASLWNSLPTVIKTCNNLTSFTGHPTPDIKEGIQLIQDVQRSAARFVAGDYRSTSSVSAVCTNLIWKSLYTCRRIRDATVFFNNHYGLMGISFPVVITTADARTRRQLQHKL